MSSIFTQFFRFGVIGGLSTVTHIVMMVILVETICMPVLRANGFAFCSALLVSYMGNHKWTFGLTGKHAFRFPRFVLVAVSCFILNQALLYQLVEIAQWDYRLGLGIVVFVVPLTSFAMNRIWVFREKTKADDLL